MKKVLTVLLTFTIVFGSIAQPTVKDALPKSPNVSSLGKYGEIPVSLSKGQINYSIPLYEVSYSDVKIPISLSYNNRGLKISDIPAWVGHGWDLNVGATIIRQVNGLPDDCFRGIFNTQMELNNYFNNQLSPQQKNDFLIRTAQGENDTQPDIYSFTIGDISGRFFFDKNRVIQQIPASALKISANFTEGTLQIASFKIIDKKGYIYDFNEGGNSYFSYSPRFPEITDASDVCPSGISTWFLTKITTPTNRVVNFLYENNGAINREDGTKVVSLKQIDGFDAQGSSICDIKSIDFGTRLSTVTELAIKEIVFDLGKIVFEKGEVRQDIQTAFGETSMKTLRSFSIYNNDNELIRKISFDFGYFGLNTRLKLKRINFLDNNEQLDNFYEFSYLNEFSPFPPLHQNLAYPGGFNSQDYWGFYNGKANPTLNPSDCIDKSYLSSYASPNYEWLSDRHSDPAFSKFGMLSKVRHPTGGETIFEYEPNQIEYPNCSVADMPQMLKASELEDVVNITLPTGQYQIIDFPLPLDNELYITAEITTTDLVGWLPPTIFFSGPSNIQAEFNAAGKHTVSNGIFSSKYNVRIKCAKAGMYSVSLHTETWDASFSSQISLTISRPINPNKRIVYADGLRIAKITSCDNFGSCKQKNFSYVNPSTIELPQFVSSSSRIGQRFINTNDGGYTLVGDCHYIYLYDAPINQTVGIEYESVIEKDEDIGKTEYLYSKITGNSQVEPYPTVIFKTWLSDIPKEVSVFSKIDSEYRVLEKTNFLYNSLAIKDGLPLTAAGITNGLKVKITYDTQNGAGIGYTFSTGLTPLYTEFNRLTSVVKNSYSYDNLGNVNGSTSTTNYEYTNLFHFQVTKAVEYTNINKAKITSYKFPSDTINNLSPLALQAKSEMVLRNMHDYNIEKIQSIEGNPVKTTLKNYELKNGLAVFSKLQEKTANNSYSTNIEITKHDKYGNSLEQKERDDIPVTFVYGYKSTSIIASIVGATFNEVLLAMGMTETQYDFESAQTNPSSDFRLRIDMLRTALPNARVTTFFYKPLVGITRIADLNNVSIYYEYDSYNRLESVRDESGNLINSYTYNLKH